MQFLQSNGIPEGSSLIPGRDGTTVNFQCYRCQDFGHLANNYPSSETRSRGSTPRSAVGLVQVRLNFAQADNMIPKSWILLDTCSTSSCCNNLALLSGLKDCTDDTALTIYTNGGQKTFNQVGLLNLFPLEVHYNATSLANIISFNTLAKME